LGGGGDGDDGLKKKKLEMVVVLGGVDGGEGGEGGLSWAQPWVAHWPGVAPEVAQVMWPPLFVGLGVEREGER